MITEQDKEVFEKNYPLYESWVKHSFVRNYTKETYNEMLTLYSKYITDKQNFSHWCSSCRAELVHNLYKWYEENKMKEIVTTTESATQTIMDSVMNNEPIKNNNNGTGTRKKAKNQIR